MSDLDRARKRLDTCIDHYGDKIGYATLELLLQKRAQDCREVSQDRNEMPTVGFDEIEGYTE